MTSDAPVDWTVAARVARRFAPAGPELQPQAARRVVRELRQHAEGAAAHVASVTGMRAEPGHPAVVVDRGAWIDSNVDSLAKLVADWPTAMSRHAEASRPVRAIGPRATGVQLGLGLGWLSGKVLGQYEALSSPGRLLLVAPTIVDVESSLGLVPRDFRLWVCLHEETHRVQFGAVPWLTGHFQGLVQRALDSFDDIDFFDRLAALARQALNGLRTGETPDIITAMQTPRQRAVLDEITGLMSLLEGHADVVMDEVGPKVIPTVADIRRKFDGRRTQVRGADSLWRRLLGMDAKLRQYQEGAVFVRFLLNRGGMGLVNRVWEQPANLPSAAEIRNPARWCERIEGQAA